MITVSDLTKSYAGVPLFEDVSLQLNAECRYGLVGANGSGKSTLLRVLAGEEAPSGGSVTIPKRARVGTLGQDHFRYDDEPIVDVAMMGHPELWRAMQEKEELLARPAAEFDAERFGELEEIVQRHDGYALESRAAEVLEGLGIPTDEHRSPMSTLSGGFRLRVLLAQTLVAGPDVLLLDEPTNHLDIVSIRWLEKFLESFEGCAVIVSHDHRFLDNVSTHILDVDYQTVTLYHGAYSHFEAAKEEERARKEAEIERREREIEEHRRSIERFKAKASRARQAQSRKKLLERVELEELPQSSRQYPVFRFDAARRSGKEVVTAVGIEKSFGDTTVLDGVDLVVRRGERVAIIGPNGIGKSTLLKILMGRLEADAGEVEWGYETAPGYFAQDHRELFDDADADETVESWLWRAFPEQSRSTVRGRLGLVLFSGEEAEKRIANISGGEATRLVFARLASEDPNVLVLDEPTNHLDLEAIDALVEGLEDFDGTLVLVSHDRWFVSELATRIVEITADGVTDYPGTYEEYLAACGDDHLDREAAARAAATDQRLETVSS